MAAETAKVPAEADCVVQFAAKCPLGNGPKRGKWLGAKGIWYSERRCRQAVYDHLASTGSHAKLTLDDCALEADTVVVERWNVSQDDPEVLADAAKANATIQEIALWQDQAVTYEDHEVRKNQKRMIPSEPLEARRGSAGGMSPQVQGLRIRMLSSAAAGLGLLLHKATGHLLV